MLMKAFRGVAIEKSPCVVPLDKSLRGSIFNMALNVSGPMAVHV